MLHRVNLRCYGSLILMLHDFEWILHDIEMMLWREFYPSNSDVFDAFQYVFPMLQVLIFCVARVYY